MLSILQNHQTLSNMLFHVKAWLSPGTSYTFNALCESRKSTRHFNDDLREDPPGYHWIPGLRGSISPCDEKKESRGTWCSEARYSCPLRLTGVPICLGFQQLQRSPACGEWYIYWVRGAVNSANAYQFVQLPLRVWGNFYALWQNIPNLSLNIWQLLTEYNWISSMRIIS